MPIRIIIEQGESSKFIASCPTLPGCWSQGDTRVEAKQNIAEAVQAYLASLQ